MTAIGRQRLLPAVLLCLGVTFAAGPWASRAAAAETDGFAPLFNGKDLTGWRVPDPNPFWHAVNGVLVGQSDENKKGNVLYTEKQYKDFVIETEVRWSGEIDSGIMLRKPELQLQIGVSRSLKKDMTCSFYTGGKEGYPQAGRARNPKLNTDGWNRIRLEARGDTFTVWLNGEKVTEYTTAVYPGAGRIGLQIHPGLNMKVEFRQVRIKEL